MQVFIIGSPYETAFCLDPKRLNKQIVECKQILSAISGESKGWVNHPVTKMYRFHEAWLALYMQCLQAYKDGNYLRACQYSKEADSVRPPFHTDLYCTHMRRRLYTKDPQWYSAASWKRLGKSEINMYWSAETESWAYYRNGKKLKLDIYPDRLIDGLVSCLNGGSEDWEYAHKIAKLLIATGDIYLIEKVNTLLDVV